MDNFLVKNPEKPRIDSCCDNEADSNVFLLPQKKKKRNQNKINGGKNGKKREEPRMSKSKQRKLKQLQAAKEKKILLEKAYTILEQHKIRDFDYSLLHSSGTIGQTQTKREKRLRAMQFSKAGLEVLDDTASLKRRKCSQNTSHDSEDSMALHLECEHTGDESSDIELLQSEQLETIESEKLENEKSLNFHQMPSFESNSNENNCASEHGQIPQETKHEKANRCIISNKPNTPLMVPCYSDRVKKIESQIPAVVHVSRPKEVEDNRASLPIVMMEQEIMETINENPAVIICGETGCGKTTQVPQFLYEAGYGSKNHSSRKGIIGITQPRRVAVLATAKRVSFELGFRLGKEVGFQVRHDKMLGDKCAIKFMTDGILLRELQSDFLLRRYSIIILDEAHERSLNTDILIGMLSRIIGLRQKMYTEQQVKINSGVTVKPEDMMFQLKLVLMSATLQVEDFISGKKLFKETPPVIKVDTRQFEIKTYFSKKTDVIDYVGQAYKKVMQIHKKLPSGGILVFVTGQREVEYLCRKLRKASQELTRRNSKERENPQLSITTKMHIEDGSEAIEENMSLEQEIDIFNTFERDEDDSEKITYSSESDTESEMESNSDDEDLINSTNPDISDTKVLDIPKRIGNLATLKASFQTLSGSDPSRSQEYNSRNSFPSVEDSPKIPPISPGPLIVLPLYARLPALAQLSVFKKVSEGERLVVVATNVAETSLTIPGIKYVVDTGREKVKNYNYGSGIETYDIQWISKASAAQRAGRAGRTGPGHCYRLYSSAAFGNAFSDFSSPQITQIPVDGVVLLMKFMGISKVENFPFPTSPEVVALRDAERCLRSIGALDSDGRIQSIGNAMAQYPMSPRHSRMVLTAIQCMKSMKGSKRANLVLGYAVAAAAALSFPNPFNMDFRKDQENIDVQNQEKLSKKKQKTMVKDIRDRFCNPSSDAITISFALHLFEVSKNPVEFCRNNLLHHKTMDEMSKLRKQLLRLIFHVRGLQEEFAWNHGNVNDVEHAWMISSNKQPLKMKEEEILCQAICAGWADRVAKRIRRVSELSEKDQKTKAVCYQSCALDDTVFLHRRSSVSQTAPEFVIYTELVQSKNRPYMHGVTEVKSPNWLAKWAVSLCSFSNPLTDPTPEYESSTDRVLCWVSPTFGQHLWQLPLHRLPIQNDTLRVSVFAYHLLKGNVLPCLKSFQKLLAAPPSSILRPEAGCQKRVGNLVNRLKIGNKTIDSRIALREAWKLNPTALYPEILCWFQDNKIRGVFEQLWSKMLSEANLVGGDP